jgi:hypothetical protein
MVDVWAVWRDPDGEMLYSFTIITQERGPTG